MKTLQWLKKRIKYGTGNDGFTLIELLIVVAIISILGAFAVSRYTKTLDNVKVSTAKNRIIQIKNDLLRYSVELGNNSFPTTEEGLQKLIDSGLWEKNKNALLDPWGNPYHYRFPGQFSDDPEVWSLGADGKEGGEGNNADIVSWE